MKPRAILWGLCVAILATAPIAAFATSTPEPIVPSPAAPAPLAAPAARPVAVLDLAPIAVLAAIPAAASLPASTAMPARAPIAALATMVGGAPGALLAPFPRVACATEGDDGNNDDSEADADTEADADADDEADEAADEAGDADESVTEACDLVSALRGKHADDADESPKTREVRRIVIAGGGHSFLGIGVAEIDSDRARTLHLKEEHGVEVKSVEDGSPAEKSGIKVGDVVLEYNSARVEGTAQFIRMVRETPPGRPAKLLVSRDGSTQTLTATLATRKPRVFRFRSRSGEGDGDSETPDPPEPPEPPEAPEGTEAFEFEMPEIDIPEIHIPQIDVPGLAHGFYSLRGARLGIETESLGSQLAEFFGVKEGVLVRSVVKGSPADRAGLKAGDVIQKVDGTKVSGPGEIPGILRSLEADKSFPISIVRSGKEMTLTAKLDEVKKRSDGSPAPRGIRHDSPGPASSPTRI